MQLQPARPNRRSLLIAGRVVGAARDAPGHEIPRRWWAKRDRSLHVCSGPERLSAVAHDGLADIDAVAGSQMVVASVRPGPGSM